MEIIAFGCENNYYKQVQNMGGSSMKRSLYFGILGFILLLFLAIQPRISLAEEQKVFTSQVILTKQGWKIASDHQQADYEATWSGDIGDGFPNGQGILQAFQNGKLVLKYEGNMLNGTMNGKGVIISADGGRYEGDWINNRKNGKGIMTFADGSRYEGEFVHDKMNGKAFLPLLAETATRAILSTIK
jgi:hypothetical protein